MHLLSLKIIHITEYQAQYLSIIIFQEYNQLNKSAKDFKFVNSVNEDKFKLNKK